MITLTNNLSVVEIQPTLDQAANTLKSLGHGSLIAGMEIIRDLYMQCECTHEFSEDWEFEIHCYNKIFAGMSKIFA
jgi:hypothetical protein